jgi:succinate dehydrogenase/fumarate reductase flavoprotein subunit
MIWRGYRVSEWTCDVLVIGSGLAGLTAAWAAARAGARVLVACKGFAGADGVSPFAGGVVLYLLPEDDEEEFLREHEHLNEGLIHAEVLRRVIRQNASLWQAWGRWGAPLEREMDGSPRRRWLRIGGRSHVPRLVVDSVELMRFLRRLALRSGVRLLEQTCLTGLLKDPAGALAGAVGFRRQDGELVIVRAPAVIVASGGCSWRGAHMGQHNVMGDGYAMAARFGAELASMEFCASYVATCSLFDSHGQCVLAALGGQFRNRLGENILIRHGLPEPAPTHQLALAMILELLEGRGPVRFDLRGISEEERRDWEERFPLVARGLRRTGRDVFAEPVPWFPGFTGSIGGSGGIRWQRLGGWTSIPGLFVAGDAAMRTPITGAGSGITFLNLAWAGVSGLWAGLSAAGWVRGRSAPEPERTDRAIEEGLRETVEPLERRKGPSPRSVLRQLQQVVVDPCVSFLRTREGLQAALSRIREIRREAEGLQARDWHDLACCHEVRHAALVAEAMLASAVVREESRGWHRRLDFPNPGGPVWEVWTAARLQGEGADADFEVWLWPPSSLRAEPPEGADDLLRG